MYFFSIWNIIAKEFIFAPNYLYQKFNNTKQRCLSDDLITNAIKFIIESISPRPSVESIQILVTTTGEGHVRCISCVRNVWYSFGHLSHISLLVFSQSLLLLPLRLILHQQIGLNQLKQQVHHLDLPFSLLHHLRVISFLPHRRLIRAVELHRLPWSLPRPRPSFILQCQQRRHRRHQQQIILGWTWRELYLTWMPSDHDWFGPWLLPLWFSILFQLTFELLYQPSTSWNFHRLLECIRP